MKLTHKLCGAALLAAVGIAVAVPNSVKAAPGAAPSAGMDIQFTANTGDGTTNTLTSGDGSGEGTITSGLVTTDAGTFGVRAITPLNFGSDNSAASGTGRHFFAKNFVANGQEGSTDKMISPNYVEFVDDRTELEHKYEITAQITSELKTTVGASNTEKKLDGATLQFLNGRVKSETDPTNTLTPTEAVATTAVEFGQPTQILGHEDATKGRGKFKMLFGTYAAGDATDSEKSVKLNIKDETELFIDNGYHGEITWSMNVLP
ncbi:hypothetical protein A5821_002135 [Enterococcus sp. 7F3_DIV0205]|uniref:WxL domain-containing protein n=1 Tax=Candidatus Enterococcus palustris TaxID=1834189 RepID=A0AAQ3WA07_9ENTE|nr:WxL domain-containing protein [Enterococcus sp. 7F3_DIV0205]OTN82574.1 hypothetical protein A5821_002485 [Enterococcus sp. 7F3_DIV0205]